MLEEKDLKKIGKLLDTKLEIKLDEKFKKELRPIKADIAKIRTDVSTLYRKHSPTGLRHPGLSRICGILESLTPQNDVGQVQSVHVM